MIEFSPQRDFQPLQGFTNPLSNAKKRFKSCILRIHACFSDRNMAALHGVDSRFPLPYH